jgi:hypothetical protein
VELQRREQAAPRLRVTLADKREAVVLGEWGLRVPVEATPDTLDGAAFREAAQESRR